MNKRKIILFYPKTDRIKGNIHLPLPVLAIGADLLKSGFQVEIIDERKTPNYERILAQNSEEVCIFGVSVMTGYQIKGGLNASRLIKKFASRIPVVWGGWHISMLPEETLIDSAIDIGVIGPGEGMLQQISEALENNSNFSLIKNIVYKRNGEIIKNPQKNNIDSVGTITKEALKLVKVSDYINQSELGSKSVFWVTSKGCPYNCSFCCSMKVYNRHWKGKSGKDIASDIQWLFGEHGINGINFVDTNFFVDKERVREMATCLIEKKLNINWAASVRVDQINLFDDEFLDLIKESGCLKLFVGAESGSREVLDLIDKNINIEDIFRMAELLDSKKIIAELYVMAGFPINPLKDLSETLMLVKEIKKHYPNHQFTSFLYTPYPGTSLYDLALRNGLKSPSYLEGWLNWNILEVKTPWIKFKGYADRLHSFIKMYYPLAFPSDKLKEKFRDTKKGWIYRLLHKIELFRIKNNFFVFPLEWPILKFINNLKVKYKILEGFGGFR